MTTLVDQGGGPVTVSSSSRVSFCGTMPSRARICGPRVAGSSPKIRSSPDVTGDTRAIIFIVDDLPAPLGPTKPNASPRRTAMSIPSTAVTSPNRFVSPDARWRTSAPAPPACTRATLDE